MKTRALAMMVAIVLLSSQTVNSDSNINLSLLSYHPSLEISRTNDLERVKEKVEISRTSELIRVLKPTLDPEIADVHARYIDANAEKWGLNRELIISVAYSESQFNSCAVSPMGAKGVMQINVRAHSDKMRARGISSKDVFLLKNNYDLGCEILHTAKKNHKSLDGALAEYLGGRDPNYISGVKRSMRKLISHRA